MDKPISITNERVRLLFEKAPQGIVSAFVTTFVVAYIYREQIAPILVIAWVGFMSAGCLLRYLAIIYYKKRKNIVPHHEKFERRYAYATGFLGAGWAVFVVTAFNLPVFEYRMYSILVLTGLVAVAIPVFSSSVKTLYIYIAPVMVISIPSLLFHGGG